jgi:hypothetical protein
MVKVGHPMLNFFCACIVISCASTRATNRQKPEQIFVTNNAAIALTEKPVSIKRSQLSGIPAGVVYPVIFTSANDTIASQLDDVDGDNKWDELFFVANLPAGSTNIYSLDWSVIKLDYTKKTSIRFGKRMSANEPVKPAVTEVVFKKDLPKSLGLQRYQTDGPSWENDKVGFRHYLDGRNAKDVFGKLIAEMSPETVGINAKGEVEDNYHVMEKWGRDILAVGNSIGIGGVALLEGNQLMRLGVTVDDSINNVDKTTFNIVTEGPVRSMMNIKYDNWKPTVQRNYSAQETVSIWPGMYAYQNSVKVSGLQGNERLGIGMVNINSVKQPTEVRIGDKWIALIDHDKHTYNKEWWLGLALILPANSYEGYIDAPKTGKLSHSFMAKLKVENNKPVNYYSVAAWELSDAGFKDEVFFRKYVENLLSQLSAEVTVTIR